MKHFAVDEKNLPEQNSSVSSTAYHWEIFITGSADRAGAPYCLIYLNKESLYLARSSSFLFQLRSSLYLARSSSFLFQLISFIVLILFSNTSFCYRNTIIDACIFDIRCLSPSTAAKTTMICLFLTHYRQLFEFLWEYSSIANVISTVTCALKTIDVDIFSPKFKVVHNIVYIVSNL